MKVLVLKNNMLLSIILGIFIVGTKADIMEVFYNKTITEDELREKIPEPTVTLLKPRGFTVSIPGFLEGKVAGIDLTGGINIFPPEDGKIYNQTYPISQDFVKTNDNNWFSEIKDIEVKTGDKIQFVIRAYTSYGPVFEDGKKYFCYSVTDNKIKKLSED